LESSFLAKKWDHWDSIPQGTCGNMTKKADVKDNLIEKKLGDMEQQQGQSNMQSHNLQHC